MISKLIYAGEFKYGEIRSVTTVANREVDINGVDIREGSLYMKNNHCNISIEYEKAICFSELGCKCGCSNNSERKFCRVT